MTDTVLTTVADGVATVTLNRPESLNSVTGAMADEVRSALDGIAEDSSVGCVVITGAGRAFCAGQDLRDPVVDTTGPTPPDLGALLTDHYGPLVKRIASMPVPVVAAVNGVAAGAGANLALSCDIVVAKESASFIQAFVKIGLVPDAAGAWLLPRLVGRARALGLAMLGDKLPAAEAERIGLIWRAVPDDDFDSEVATLAARLAASPTDAVVETRRLIDVSADLDLDAALEVEAEVQGTLGRGANFAEGVAAFTERRDPNFNQH